MEDLVRPRAADAADHALIAKQRVQSARLIRQHLAQALRADVQCVGAEVSELELGLLRSQQPYACALLRARFGEHELRAVLEGEPERGRLRSRLSGAQEAKTACGHQV